jgi:amidase/6-aminohexanoate-cyclic-dimer hydrolase
VHPDCAEAARSAGRLLSDLGHHVEPFRPEADHEGMIRAWVDIVAVGTALWFRKKLDGHDLEGLVEGVARGAMAHGARLTGEDYLAAISRIHAYGRQMAAAFAGIDVLLSPTMAEPPAAVGRFGHATDDYLAYRLGPRGSGPIRPSAPPSTPRASRRDPSAPLVGRGAARGRAPGPPCEDETLIALWRELEMAGGPGSTSARPSGHSARPDAA